ncbi:hypothetical protein LBMAG42_27840 [Deltaproteobacteria bacterium]|nr:hypothetical protein LBMAG42_27840 [Deltaproteobacteria bacterium]
MGAAQKPATFDQMFAAIRALPEGEHGEILGPGLWRTMSRPGASHRRASKRVASRLGSMDVDAGGGWWLEVEAELRLDDRLHVPDLAGWRVPDGDLAFTEANPITRRPDWVCEILSRTTQRADRVIKLPTYAKAGVAHVWVIDTERSPCVESAGIPQGDPVGPVPGPTGVAWDRGAPGALVGGGANRRDAASSAASCAAIAAEGSSPGSEGASGVIGRFALGGGEAGSVGSPRGHASTSHSQLMAAPPARPTRAPPTAAAASPAPRRLPVS